MVFKGRFVADVFLEFLNRLLRQHQRKIFLIVDRHPVHRSKKVKHWSINKVTKFVCGFCQGIVRNSIRMSCSIKM